MRPQLEELLKSFDAYVEAGRRAGRLLDAYEFKLEDVAKATGFPKETLRVAVQAKYLRWVRANTRPPTLPPKA